jgi:hypothetical protein
MKKVNWGLWLAMLRAFDYSWRDIDYKYEQLTANEKKLMSETEFNYLVSEIEALKNDEKNGVVYK